ncbi:hypothetical protein SDC9_183253 [bioreactor metagenome]|uniref:Uncharacterized protein n=1 Tax=bioreactor metagenome TaxID=1076179 RepID=A0A645HI10_9ZZZZ
MRKAPPGFVGRRGGQGITALIRKLDGTTAIADAAAHDAVQLGRDAVFGDRPRDAQVSELG